MTDAPIHDPVNPDDETPTWLENPRFSLESLSPGQRYTAVIVAGLIACMLAFGINRTDNSSSSPAGAAVTGSGAGPGVGSASAGPASASGTGASSAGATADLSSSSVAGGGSALSASGPSSGAATSSAGPTAGSVSGGGGTTASGPTGHPVSTAGGGNGGATFRGVTANKITIGFVNLDASTLGAACPRCGTNDGANGAAANALVAAWRKDGLLPINGRDFNIVQIKYSVLNSEEERSACLQMAQNVHPFIVGGVSMLGGLDQCLAVENHLLTMDGEQSGDEAYLANTAPYAWQIQPSADRVWRNFPVWLDKHGLLKGQVIGLYSPDDSVNAGEQEDLDRSFRAELHKLGYKLAVDMTYGNAPNDALAVARFRGAGVTTAVIIGQLTEPSGFQNVAVQQGYHPKYPIPETSGIETNDSVADVTYNANAEDGNLGMKTVFWQWSSRQPPHAVGDARAEYCARAYEAYTHKTLDAYNNVSEMHYMLEICSTLEVIRDAMVRAGPDLTQNTFVNALEQTKGFQASFEVAGSFSSTKHDFGDDIADAAFRKARWQPTNEYWKVTTPWVPYYLP